MKIFKDLTNEIPDTNSHHWNFEPYESDDGNILAVGYNSLSIEKLIHIDAISILT